MEHFRSIKDAVEAAGHKCRFCGGELGERSSFCRMCGKRILSGIIVTATLILSHSTMVMAYEEYPEGHVFQGSWQKTGNFKTIGPKQSPVTKDGFEITTEFGDRDGDDPEAVIEFTSVETSEYAGESACFEVEVDNYKDVYYPGEYLGANIELEWQFTSKNTPGEVVLSASAIEPDFSKGEEGLVYSVVEQIPLFNSEGDTEYQASSKNLGETSKIRDGYIEGHKFIDICYQFPENGDIPAMWLLVDVAGSGDTHMYMLWEFVWSDEEYELPGEDMSWVRETGGYYDAGTGFIEYFPEEPSVDSTTASANGTDAYKYTVKETNPIVTILTIALFFLVPAAIIIGFIVLIIVLVKKKKKT